MTVRFLVVVVVVVCAMQSEKTVCGAQLAEFRKTIGRAESNPHKTSNNISLSEFDEIKRETEYLFRLSPTSKLDLPNAEFTAKTHKSSDSFTIPKRVIKDMGLKPGHTIDISVYELAKSDQEGSLKALGESSVNRDADSSDGLSTNLISNDVWEYLKNERGGKARLMYVNQRNGEREAALAKAHNSKSSNSFSFPARVRHSIDAQPGDIITIYEPDNAVDSGSDNPAANAENVERKVDELHRMVSELYEAYLENKND